MQETMQQTLDYLYGLTRFGMKLGLEVITKLLNKLNNPQNSYKTIHIAGTNGKGSTAAFIASILKESGYKVGLYTSPHLVKFNERIQVNGREITDEELVNYTKLIKEKTHEANVQPTFFEFTTTMAFLHFQKQKVDFAIIETGMGGRLDATNVLNPEISVITNISFDHMEHLGEDKLDIAKEKAAIIKENGTVVTVEQDSNVLELFESVCREKNAKLFIVKKKIKPKISMLGEYQIRNAATAMKVAELLSISKNKIEQGLLKTKWPGRLDVIKENPLVIVDCAHNVEGMRNLIKFVKKIDRSRKEILILGMAEDKEIDKMVSLIVPLFDEVVLTKGNYKPAELDVLEKEVRKHTNNIKMYEQVEGAISEALKLAEKEDLILVTGSIYLVGDVLKHRNLFK